MFSHTSRLLWLLMLTLAVCSSADAQQGKKPSLTSERDKDKEDQVAKLFETIRADAKIPQLIKIRHRESLEQTVCTVAVTGKLPKHSLTHTLAIYKTAKPELISSELNQVALFNDLHPKQNPPYGRYSVAVWRVNEPHLAEASYWVGVQIYWTAASEFFDNHFTDDIYYHNDWKKSVAPECRGE